MAEYDLSDLTNQARWITDIQLYIAHGSISFIETLIDNAIKEDITQHRERMGIQEGPIHLPADADCITYEVVFQPFISESLIISIHSVLEVVVTQYCDFCKAWANLTVSYKDCEGRGMEKKFNYMTEVLGLDLQKNTETWEHLMAWGRVRHVLVHNDGNLVKDEWYRQCKKIGIKVEAEDDRRVVIDFSDCKRYLKTITAFLSTVYSQIPKPKF